MTIAQSLSSHKWVILKCISLHVSLYKTENTKAQKMRTIETHKYTQALTENTVIPKEGRCLCETHHHPNKSSFPNS